MKSTIPATITAVAFIFASGSVADVSAKTKVRHHRHLAHAPAPLDAREPYARGPFVEARDPDRFYPNEIEGGVSGNLPFNNQLRKLSDPLNANGGGG